MFSILAFNLSWLILIEQVSEIKGHLKIFGENSFEHCYGVSFRAVALWVSVRRRLFPQSRHGDQFHAFQSDLSGLSD